MTQSTTDALTDQCMALAMDMAARARTIVLGFYGTAPDVEDKADQSPVTKADRECEAALREMIPGLGATRNGAAVRCRPCPDLARAWLYTTSPQMHQGLDFGRFEDLRHRCRHGLYGGDCYSYGLVARGRTDLVCDSSMQPYDYAALVPIVEGAGGRMTDWSGGTLGLAGDGTVIAAGDAALHAQAVAVLGG